MCNKLTDQMIYILDDWEICVGVITLPTKINTIDDKVECWIIIAPNWLQK